MVRPARFERATFRFGGEYSIQLSYGRMMRGRDTTRRNRLASSRQQPAERKRDSSCQ
jgi:hypothetical protein